MLVNDYNYLFKTYDNMYDPVQGSTSPSGQLLHEMSVWHTNINCSIFVLNM